MERKALVLAGTVFVLSIIITPRLPFQDYADWIYQGQALKQLLLSDPEYTETFATNPPVVPNSAVTILLTFLSFVFPPDFSGRILVAGSTSLMFIGLKRLFNGRERDNNLLTALTIILIPNYFLFGGLLSFYLGLSIFFIFTRSLDKERPSLYNLVLYSVTFIIIFYTHFLAFMLAVAYAFIVQLGFRSHNRFKLRNVSVSLIPVSILSFLYFLHTWSDLASNTLWKYSILGKANDFVKGNSVVYLFNDMAPLWAEVAVAMLNLLFVLSLTVLCLKLLRGHGARFLRSKKIVFAALCLILGLASPYLIAQVYNPSQRFFWLALVFMLAAALESTKKMGPRTLRLVVAGSIILTVIRSAGILFQGSAERDFEETLAKSIPASMSFVPVMISFEMPEHYVRKTGLDLYASKLCPWVNCRNRAPLYLAIARKSAYAGTFRTGIIKPRHAGCDIKSMVEFGETPDRERCKNILFISPRGFTNGFLQRIESHFTILREGSAYILARFAQEKVDMSIVPNVNIQMPRG